MEIINFIPSYIKLAFISLIIVIGLLVALHYFINSGKTKDDKKQNKDDWTLKW